MDLLLSRTKGSQQSLFHMCAVVADVVACLVVVRCRAWSCVVVRGWRGKGVGVGLDDVPTLVRGLLVVFGSVP